MIHKEKVTEILPRKFSRLLHCEKGNTYLYTSLSDFYSLVHFYFFSTNLQFSKVIIRFRDVSASEKHFYGLETFAFILLGFFLMMKQRHHLTNLTTI